MPTSILATKLYVPPPRSKVVRRRRLFDRLNEGLHRRMTLISGPAGFGKTTLVSEWIAACERSKQKPRVAWLSLDAADGNLTRFLTYFVAALQTVVPAIGEGVLAVLEATRSPRAESVLTDLINEIAAVSDDIVLVLDDYHVIDARPVDEALAFLLEHLPPQMHLVITTREDPQLPLSRLRARDQMNEVRAVDLRFTADEAATFLKQVMDLNLSAEDVSSLGNRAEGWVAGLQLAALSLRGREDIPGFIRDFAGDNRYIVDYLLEEVLHGQPGQVRNFLLQTSILERLNGPLCDAVCCGSSELSFVCEEGSVLLEALERGNLFVIPLDDKRHWYRYHHLFADVLQARLLEEQPEQVPFLHQRASEWYEHNGSPADAVHHALAAEDFERAARLIELAWPTMDRSRQSAPWLSWAKALPDELVRTRPVLSAGCAWANLDVGELEAAEERLRDAERWLDTAAGLDGQTEASAAGMVVVDVEEFRSLPATVATARAYHALALGDVTEAVRYARRALALLPEPDHLRRGIAGSLLGLATWTGEDLAAAYRSFAEAMTEFEMAGNILFAITGTNVLADIRLAQGRLREAVSIYEQALQRATEQGGSVMRGTPELYVGLSELLREQGDLETATRHLLKSEELGKRAGLPRWHYRWCLAQARIQQARGELEVAGELLDEAERRYIRGPVPEMRPIGALKARLRLAQGRLSEALTWVHEQGLSGDNEISYLREFEHITLARVLIAKYQRDREDGAILEAVELLHNLLQAAQEGGRTGSEIEILVQVALAHAVQGDISAALTSLERALTLAEPQGYVGVFVDEGMPMAQLLFQATARGIMPAYTAKLLTLLVPEEQARAGQSLPPSSPALQPLVEPLSQRELEVLQLLAEGLSNREIGERLFLALSTVKGHNRNIYGKLQVKRRTEAVARARELGLL